MSGSPRLFLLSPASVTGKRAALLLNPAATFDLARSLQTVGVPLGELFSFISGLYFRGKIHYTARFAGPQDLVRIITSDRGLLAPDVRLSIDDLRTMSRELIDPSHPPYREPLDRDLDLLSRQMGSSAQVILLGSVATDKYATVITPHFGDRLFFPQDFIGRGDMSRGGLMLRCAREGRELDYISMTTAPRRGARPARLHPSRALSAKASPSKSRRDVIIPDHGDAEIEVDGVSVKLTNLHKLYWPKDRITKGDLLRYYLGIAPILLPHLRDRAMVMKRYPDGIDGEMFFMKHIPPNAPEWIARCRIDHASGNIVDFPMIQDRASLLWVVNLGCIDLNQWYARCGNADTPDYLHFDLDPTPGAGWSLVTKAALIVGDALKSLGMPTYIKTTGSRGYHIYVPIVRGPSQKMVWEFAKAFANTLSEQHAKVLTAVYRVAARPKRHVLVDYNQNAWGRTLAAVYSPRPRAGAPVSAPVTWQEVQDGVKIQDFTIATMPARLKKVGDLWKGLDQARGRFRLEKLL